jgi:PTS system N-acetylglucosamine-specific IIC component
VANVAPPQAEQWLNALGGGDNVLQLDCVAMTRLRLRLADDRALSESQLKTLGCQGISRLDGGIWHLLVGESAQGLSTALKALASRDPVRTGA